MNLNGKTLLLMGGGAYANDIKKYKDEKDFRIITLGRDANTPISKIADAFYQINTQNVDAVCEVVKKEHVDGIFVGSSEINISPAIDVAERTGIHFYVDRKQWDILADKAEFKKACRKYGVPVVPEYDIRPGYTREDIEKLPYPVLLKPVDSSGARGMNACYKADDFDYFYDEAMKWSKKKEIIVEKLITEADETFFQYTIQDGNVSLTSCFTKVFTNAGSKELILPIFHMYPSKHIDEYFSSVHENVVAMFKAYGVANGVMTLQSFYKDGQFYVFEAGFRMGGAQNYIFSEYQSGTNSLNYMINYALTGSMADERILENESAYFKYPCCNYYVGLKPGTIAEMNDADEIRKLPGVLNVTVMSKVGDVVENTNALERICFRIHVAGKDVDELAENLVRISDTISVKSASGDNMLLEPLNKARCIEAICGATIYTEAPKNFYKSSF